MNDNLTITQKGFLFKKRHVEVDLTLQTVKITYTSLLKHQIFNINLYEIDENPQRITKDSLGWLVFSILFSLLILIKLFISFFSLVNNAFFTFSNWAQVLFLLSINFLSWNYYLSKRLDLWVFMSRFNPDQQLFGLYANVDKTAYLEFAWRLRNILKEQKKGKDLRLIIKQIPIKTLLNEFQTSYIDELLKRNIDVLQVLEFLKKNYLKKNI